MRAITPVFSVLLIIILSVALVGFIWLFFTGTFNSLKSTGTSTVGESLTTISSCMKIESVYGNQVSIRNCGKGIIAMNTLSAYLDDVPLNIISVGGQPYGSNVFGKTDIGASTDGWSPNREALSKFTLNGIASVQSITAYMQVNTGGHITYAIYNVSGGAPGILLGKTQEINPVSGGGWAWQTASFASPITLSPGDYYLLAGADIAFQIKYDTLAGDGYGDGYLDHTYPNYPSTWSGGTADDRRRSIYATYTTSVINEDETGTISLSGLWNFNAGGHTLRIANPRVVTEVPVNAVLPDSTVMDLEFDEGSGTIAHDSSGNGNDGTLGNGTAGTEPQWTSNCKFGGCLSFTGTPDVTADVVVVNDIPNTSVTVAAWIYPKKIDGGPTGDQRAIASKWTYPASSKNEWLFRLSNNTQSDYDFYINNGTDQINAVADSNIVINRWYHVMFSYDIVSGKVVFYKDGVPLSETYVGVARDTSEPVRIGAQGGGSFDPFDGMIDSVRVYNQALTPDQTISLRPVSYD